MTTGIDFRFYFSPDRIAVPFGLSAPIKVFRCTRETDLTELFRALETESSAGRWVAGYLSYEAGYLFEERLRGYAPSGELGLFAVFDAPGEITAVPSARDYTFGWGGADLSREVYEKKVERIRGYLRDGDIYQANFTFKGKFRIEGGRQGFFDYLFRRQNPGYAAYLKTGGREILSLSPELFFHLKDGTVRMKPMKGTIRRGDTPAEDIDLRNRLRADEKNLAENLMIVDLIRNDVSRIGRNVRVEKSFEIEEYPTLYQMTSTVAADIAPGTSYFDVFAALFPCGSITGAPKIRAMEIIRETELGPRGIYTGAIGWIAPWGEMMFNVAIRTLVIENGAGEIGVGSGIVYDSVPDAEYDECLLKAEFLNSAEREGDHAG